MITAGAYNTHMDQLFERIKRLHATFDSAGIEYRVVGGLAVFFRFPWAGQDVGAPLRTWILPSNAHKSKGLPRSRRDSGFNTGTSLESTCWWMQ